MPAPFDFEKLFSVPAGEELPTDNATDDRMDTALQARSEAYRQADALQWLMDTTRTASAPEKSSAASPDPDAPRGLAAAIRDDQETLAAEDRPGIAGAVAGDVFWGSMELPRQTVGGMRDAVQATLDLSKMLDELGERLSLGGLQFTDAEGNFAPRYVGPEEWNKLVASGEMHDPLATLGGIQFTDESGKRDIQYLSPSAWQDARRRGLREEIPFQVSEPSTYTGGVIRSISQFLR